jgi:division protein CdvB (Snf7/Vps24/ESCRT-III family)
MTFDEWQEKQSFSPVSPEASTAEAAWNAAISQSIRATAIIASTADDADMDADEMAELLKAELTELNTGTGETY